MNYNNITKRIKLNPQKEFPVIGIKIIGEKYAPDFVNKGVVHFSNPQIWRDSTICSGKQLDKDEGCFCYSTVRNDLQFLKIGRHFECSSDRGGWKYFEKTGLIVGACFYGVLKSSFRNTIMRYGVKTIPSQNAVIPKDYFDTFIDGCDKTINQKAIIIFDLPKFCKMIIDKSIEMGALKEEIFISTVYYVNKKVPFCTVDPFPFEYFLKDDSFSNQAELRIIIASKNEDFYKNLQNSNYNITIGDISQFSVLQDQYTSDLDLSIQGDKLLYKLSSPITLTMDDRSFAELVMELYQILQNHLPGEPKSQDELKNLSKPIIEHINTKFGVEFKDDWRLYNVPKKLYFTLPDLYKGLCESIIEQ